MRRRLDALAGASALTVTLAAIAVAASESAAQTPPVRLAAPADCSTHPDCARGLRRAYGVDPGAGVVPLSVADAGIEALDDNRAEVAIVFTSNPGLSRPDLVTLRDDRHMLAANHVVPVVRTATLQRYGADLRKRLNRASALLTTPALRGLNQQVYDGRLPEAVGGEFVDSNGLFDGSPRRPGPPVVVGYEDFTESRILAHMYAGALRGGGYRTRVRSLHGLGRQAVAALRTGRIDVLPAYEDSLHASTGGTSLRSGLARLHAQPLALAPARDGSAFVMRAGTAERLGVTRISDLARYWPAAGAGATAHKADDPRQPEQWAVAESSVLDIRGAWALSQGAGAVVAIIDTGVKIDHPDLAPNIWTNAREIADNGVDDDGNGYVDDDHGVDLTSPEPRQDLRDLNGHGTHVAGIVAAAANGRGVVGIAPRARIMVIKALDAEGNGTTGAVAEGIRYAAANGARIVNISIQGDAPDARLEAAVEEAAAANVLLVVSAGNSGRDLDAVPSYPAAIAARNLISVASTRPDDGRTLDPTSNFGRLTVQLAAPGEEILSTSLDDGYDYKSGTSMAAPMATGVAALMAAVNPRLGAADLRALLLERATRSDLPVGAGYLDAVDSVLAAASAVAYADTQRPRLRILQASANRGRTEVRAAIVGSTQAVHRYRIRLDGRRMADMPVRSSLFNITIPRRGRHVRIDALDASGRSLASANRSIGRRPVGKREARHGRKVSA